MAELLIITRNEKTYSHSRFLKSAQDLGHLVEVLNTQDFCWGAPKKYDMVLHRDSGISFDDVDLVLTDSLLGHGNKVVNSPDTLKTLRGKDRQYSFFQTNNLPHIPTLITRGLSGIENVYPNYDEVIVKTIRGNQGRGVELVKRIDLPSLLESNQRKKDERFIIQPRLHFQKEFRVLTLGNEIQGTMEKTCLDDFKANAKNCENKPVHIPNEIKAITEKIQQFFPGEFLGLDFGLDDDGYRLIEINTTPGFEVFDQVFETDIAKKLWEKYL